MIKLLKPAARGEVERRLAEPRRLVGTAAQAVDDATEDLANLEAWLRAHGHREESCIVRLSLILLSATSNGLGRFEEIAGSVLAS